MFRVKILLIGAVKVKLEKLNTVYLESFMRRYIFYFLIAITAFAVSIFFSLKFLSVNEKLTENKQHFVADSQALAKEGALSETSLSDEIRFVCRDGNLKTIWLDFLKEKELAEYLFNRLGETYDCAEMLKVKTLDLNDDGEDEYVASLWLNCGSKGNCPTAIYWERSGKYSRLMYHSNKMYVEITNTKNFGYRDIKTFFGLGLNGMYIETYTFTGKSYKRKQCFDWKPEMEKDEMIPTKCWESEN
jgi:hypothetical protein